MLRCAVDGDSILRNDEAGWERGREEVGVEIDGGAQAPRAGALHGSNDSGTHDWRCSQGEMKWRRVTKSQCAMGGAGCGEEGSPQCAYLYSDGSGAWGEFRKISILYECDFEACRAFVGGRAGVVKGKRFSIEHVGLYSRPRRRRHLWMNG